jgi:hypothetical protein
LAFCTQTKQKKGKRRRVEGGERERLRHVVRRRANCAKKLLEEKSALAFFCQSPQSSLLFFVDIYPLNIWIFGRF